MKQIDSFLAKVHAMLSEDLRATQQLIGEQLVSEAPLIEKIAHHIMDSGGKRLRPLLVLLSANTFGYQGSEHHELATVIEFVHTATLLHDDVVDKSELRRGQKTANEVWGNQASVLVGDFLYSRAFQLLTKRNNAPIMKILADATNSLAEGEMTQLTCRFNPHLSEEDYLQIIQKKTAVLFAVASEIGAILGNADPMQQKASADYGLHLGMAFQIIDDLLDYMASPDEIGKNIGDDLAEGKTTLPLIYALRVSSTEQAHILRSAIRHGDLTMIQPVQQIITDTQACQYSHQQAQHQIKLALNALDRLPPTPSPHRQALIELTQFVLDSFVGVGLYASPRGTSPLGLA